MTPGKKQAFEPTGLIPRSIVRTFERFYKQLLPRTKYSAIREYRISRYQVLVSIRCLCTLLVLPLVTRIIAAGLIFPQIQYFWDVTYQDSHVFSEIDQFSQVIFFDSLLDQDSLGTEGSFASKIYEVPISTLTEGRVPVWNNFYPEYSKSSDLVPQLPLLTSKNISFCSEARLMKQAGITGEPRYYNPLNHSRLHFASPKVMVEASPVKQPENQSRRFKKRATLSQISVAKGSSFFTDNENRIPIETKCFIENKDLTQSRKSIYDDFSIYVSLNASSSIALNQRPMILSNESRLKPNKLLPSVAPPMLRLPSVEAYVSVAEDSRDERAKVVELRGQPSVVPVAFRAVAGSPNQLSSKKSAFKHFYLKNTQLRNKSLQDQALQEKIFELAQSSHSHALQSLTNVFADFLSIVVLIFLLITLKPEITILKSFLIEVIYNLSDTTKSFLLILMTDLLVGFHSPRGWETMFSLILHHFGLPENQDFVFLFVATLPVILDTVFKYWIFRHLNKISPSTVATYHNMIE